MGFIGRQGGGHHGRRQTRLQMLLVLPLDHIQGTFAVEVLMMVLGTGAKRRPLRGTGRGGHGASNHAVYAGGRGGRGDAGRRASVLLFRGWRTVHKDVRPDAAGR